jgi:hypothetical protein
MSPQSNFREGMSNTLLLDSFFIKEDQKLIEKLRMLRQVKETKEELSNVSGITNDAVLQKLVDLNVRPETFASITLVPLVEMAWADGSIDEDEKKAVLTAVKRMGFPEGSTNHDLVARWVVNRPAPEMLDAWIHYVQGLCENLTTQEIQVLKKDLVEHTRQIARASGGFLGLGNKISKAEKEMLTKLESAFEKK